MTAVDTDPTNPAGTARPILTGPVRANDISYVSCITPRPTGETVNGRHVLRFMGFAVHLTRAEVAQIADNWADLARDLADIDALEAADRKYAATVEGAR